MGRPHQKPRPTNTATNTGASAVPSPSSAFSTRTDRSTPSGWNTEAYVLRIGTVRPNPAPRNAVAASSSGYAADWSVFTPALTISSPIAAVLHPRPIR